MKTALEHIAELETLVENSVPAQFRQHPHVREFRREFSARIAELKAAVQPEASRAELPPSAPPVLFPVAPRSFFGRLFRK